MDTWGFGIGPIPKFSYKIIKNNKIHIKIHNV